MKIKCIENKSGYITVGKIYKVINNSVSNYGYRIMNDYGFVSWFDCSYFKTLSEIRNETINKLLEDESKMYN
jgi:hypothetical protein